MILNTEINHNHTLITVLREEITKLKRKLNYYQNSYQQIESEHISISIKQSNIDERIINISNHYKPIMKLKQNQIQTLKTKINNINIQNNDCLQCLRSKLKRIKFLKEKKKSEKQQHQNLEDQKQLKMKQKQQRQQELKMKKKQNQPLIMLLEQIQRQKQIGQNRIILRKKQLEQQIIFNSQLMQQIRKIKNQIIANQARIKDTEQIIKLYSDKQQAIVDQSITMCQMIHRSHIQNAMRKQNMQNIQRKLENQRKQYSQDQIELQQITIGYSAKLSQCEKTQGTLLLKKTESNSVDRMNLALEHKIQCTKIMHQKLMDLQQRFVGILNNHSMESLSHQNSIFLP